VAEGHGKGEGAGGGCFARKKKCYQFCEVLRRLRVHALHINKPWSISFSIGGWPPGIALVVHMQYASAPLKTNRLHDSAKSASEILGGQLPPCPPCSYSTAIGKSVQSAWVDHNICDVSRWNCKLISRAGSTHY
jgi:hypothetical protein